nr:unnamed protein product [Spirometra erinaceieuropaei]
MEARMTILDSFEVVIQPQPKVKGGRHKMWIRVRLAMSPPPPPTTTTTIPSSSSSSSSSSSYSSSSTIAAATTIPYSSFSSNAF